MANGMPSTSLQDWKAATAPLLPQKRRWYDAGGFPYRSARTKQPRTRVVGCIGCGGAPNVHSVSKTNDHSRELTVPVQKTELVQTKVKWEIYFRFFSIQWHLYKFNETNLKTVSLANEYLTILYTNKNQQQKKHTTKDYKFNKSKIHNYKKIQYQDFE
ncbi:Hypothetical_protein [Hexamita inflata]|uniref:Hypothetical_protein n=1 Tax=Hexamita inflata TaxID=28002 RepID=A0AA86UDJ9_9EUKA|nr:Hypothetical protein HINF_LOCUS41595 [Hexamita inflata]